MLSLVYCGFICSLILYYLFPDTQKNIFDVFFFVISATDFSHPAWVFLLLNSRLSKNTQAEFNLSVLWARRPPLSDGHLLCRHAVRQCVSRLCRRQQVSRAVSAEVLAVVQGQRLGLDQSLGKVLRFRGSLRRPLSFRLRLERFGEWLDESLRLGLGLWGVSEKFGVSRWRLGVGWGFRKRLRRPDAVFLMLLLLAVGNVGNRPGGDFSYEWPQRHWMIQRVWKEKIELI